MDTSNLKEIDLKDIKVGDSLWYTWNDAMLKVIEIKEGTKNKSFKCQVLFPIERVIEFSPPAHKDYMEWFSLDGGKVYILDK